RRQRQHRRARATEVLVRRIDYDIGVGRVMDRRDLAMTDSDSFVQDLDHRSQAVGCAGRRRQQAVFLWFIAMVIDADYDIECTGLFDRGRDDDPLHAAPKVAVELLALQELAGAFQHNVATEIAPGDTVCRWFGAEADPPVADLDGAVVLGAEFLAPA